MPKLQNHCRGHGMQMHMRSAWSCGVGTFPPVYNPSLHKNAKAWVACMLIYFSLSPPDHAHTIVTLVLISHLVRTCLPLQRPPTPTIFKLSPNNALRNINTINACVFKHICKHLRSISTYNMACKISVAPRKSWLPHLNSGPKSKNKISGWNA